MEIREATLKGEPAVKFALGGTTYIVPAERYEKLRNLADAKKKLSWGLLGRYKGYLFSDDRTDLKHVSRVSLEDLVAENVVNNERISLDNMKGVLARAKKLQSEGIPPIFIPEQESNVKSVDERGYKYYHYPTLDGIINLFSRAREDGGVMVANRASIEKVKFFRDYATREDFKDSVLKELKQRIDEIYSGRFSSEGSREYVLECVEEGFEHLVKELSKIPRQDSFSLKVYDEETDAKEIASMPFWYSQFTKDSANLILQRYWNQFTQEFLDSDKTGVSSFVNEYPGAKINAGIFPDVAPDFEELRRVKPTLIASRVLNKAIETKNYSGLTKRIFDYMDNEQREILEREIEKDISEKFSGNDLPSTSKEVSEKLGIPYNDPAKEMLYPIIRRVEIRYLEGLSDNELVEWINKTSQKTTPKIREYLGGRVYNIIGEGDPNSTKKKDSFANRAREIGFESRKLASVRYLYNLGRLE